MLFGNFDLMIYLKQSIIANCDNLIAIKKINKTGSIAEESGVLSTLLYEVAFDFGKDILHSQLAAT